MIGRSTMRSTMAWVSAPGPDRPTNMSAPSMMSSSVRASVSRAKRRLFSSRSLRPLCTTPWRSATQMLCGGTPR